MVIGKENLAREFRTQMERKVTAVGINPGKSNPYGTYQIEEEAYYRNPRS